MTLTRSFVRNAVTTPLDARLMNMAALVANADGSPRTGVLGTANASIVATTATMNVTVAAAEFAASKGKADGVAIFTNDGTVNVLIGAAPASNSRIDVIWVKHNDNTTGDADSLPVFGVTAGVAAPAPTKPAIPTGALELATLRIYSGTTATNGGSNTLTNTYQMTSARGGIVGFRTKADLDLWTTAQPWQRAVVLANGSEWKWSGSTWLPLTAGTKTTYKRPSTAMATNASLAAIPSMAVVFDGGDFTHAAGVFTCVKAGTYRVDLSVSWAANAAGGRAVRLLQAGSASETRSMVTPTPTAGIDYNVSLFGLFTCIAGDTITAMAQQSSGGNLNVWADVVIERIV